MIPLNMWNTRGLGSARESRAKTGKMGKVRLPIAERRERIVRLTHAVKAKILVRPRCVSDLLQDPDLDAYETELRSILAALVTNGFARKVPHPMSAKVFYKGVPQ